VTELPTVTPETVLFRAALHLVGSTEGAATLDQAARIRGRSVIGLLAEETGMSADQVREIIERRPSDYVADAAP